jgi:hypothetical protein
MHTNVYISVFFEYFLYFKQEEQHYLFLDTNNPKRWSNVKNLFFSTQFFKRYANAN